jgi:multidrug resistance protein MdtO
LLVLEQDPIKALTRILQLRDQLNAGFQAVTAQADAVLLEFGPSRPRKLEIREDMRRWQPAIRTLLVVQVTAAQYLVQKPLTDLPERVAQAVTAFERDVAHVMRAMANEMNGNPVDAVPDIRQSFAQLQQRIQNYCQDLEVPLSPQESDVISLAESLASILAPLYEDIHATIARDKEVIGPLPQPRLGEA